MQFRHSWPALGLLALLTFTPFQPLAQGSALQGEHMIAPTPDGWRLFEQSPETGTYSYIPEGQNVEGWLDMIAIRIQTIQDDYMLQVLNALDRQYRRVCTFSDTTVIDRGQVNGYEFATASLICSEDQSSGLGVYAQVKVIEGIDRGYSVQIVRRGDPLDIEDDPLTQWEHARWTAYLNGVTVCDMRSPGHPCTGDGT